MKNVYTYYGSVSLLSPEHETKLILEWKENWSDFGFDPIVLNEYHARQHPRFKELEQAVAKFPSTNPAGYDKHCFYRWAAFSQIGGGISSDYDCFNYGWKGPNVMPRKLHLFQGHVPCLVTGDKGAYEKMIDAVINYEVDRKDYNEGTHQHVSDMYIFLHLARESDGLDAKLHDDCVKQYKEEGWETAPAVHFSTGSMTPDGKLPRHKFIKQLRPWK